MKRQFWAAMLCLCMALLTACSGKAGWETISPEEAKSLMEQETEYVLLDVRTQEEYDAGHIQGAILLPDTEVEEQAETVLGDRQQLILVYCRSGRRSAASAEMLAKLGYTNVKDFGGIINWPYETVTEKKTVPECSENSHQWMEDCTGRTCAVCGKYERVAP